MIYLTKIYIALKKFSLLFNDILLDFAKQQVTLETIELLLALAQQQGLEDWIARLFSGEKVNNTEHRAALHSALRDNKVVMVDGKDVMPSIKRVLQQMENFQRPYTMVIRKALQANFH